MKTIILTASLGGGHNAAARAVKQALEEAGHFAEIVDLYAYLEEETLIGKGMKQAKEKGYILSLKTVAKLPPLMDMVYSMNEKREGETAFLPDKFEAGFVGDKLAALFAEYKPDAVVCTQVYAAEAVSLLKVQGRLDALAVGVITDFTVQTYWQDTVGLDYVVAASAELEYELAGRGIGPERTLPFGIPVGEAFRREPQSPARVKKELDLPPELPMVLMMGGSMGFGNLEKDIRELDTLPLDFSLVVVCGTNQEMQEKLEALGLQKPARILGFTNDVPTLMDGAALIVTKPGGITASEALAKRLPIVINDPIPGLETRNTEFLQNRGCAAYATRITPLAMAVYDLLRWPARRERMQQNMIPYSKPASSADLARFLAGHCPRR